MATNGELEFTINGGFEIGELSGEPSARVQDLSTVLQDSGVNSAAVAHILTLQWSKFVMWVGMIPAAILTRLESYKFASDPGCALIWARVTREAAAIAKTMGIPLEDIGPFPVESMVCGSEEDAVSAIQELGRKFETAAPNYKVSALQDLERGRTLEIDDTLGHAVDEARRLGIPAPTLEMCYSLCKGINRFL